MSFKSIHSNDYHPYYISVTEITYNTAEKEIEIACKIFTDDFENVLRADYNNKTDLYHPVDKAVTEKQIAAYVNKHLQLSADGKLIFLKYVGYEIEGEAAWCYFSSACAVPPKNIDIMNDLLYQYKKEQVNIMHVKINTDRKSARLAYPDTRAKFDF
ncbi:MAG: hypothetical protein QM802_10950 [Agriterribacter sp.]